MAKEQTKKHKIGILFRKSKYILLVAVILTGVSQYFGAFDTLSIRLSRGLFFIVAGTYTLSEFIASILLKESEPCFGAASFKFRIGRSEDDTLFFILHTGFSFSFTVAMFYCAFFLTY